MQVYIMDAETKQVLADELNWLKFSVFDWSKDEKGFFYNRYPTPTNGKKDAKFDANAAQKTAELLDNKVYYHRVGTKQDNDVLVYEDPAHRNWMFEPGVTYDGKYLMLQTTRDTKAESLVSFADISNGKLEGKIKFTELVSNWIGTFSYIYNMGTKFYFQTNYKAPKGRIIMIDLKFFNAKNPELTLYEVIPESKDYVLGGATCIGGKLVVKYMQDASDRMYIYDFN